MATPQTQLEKRESEITTSQMAAGVAALWTRSRIGWASMDPLQRRWSIVAVTMLITLLGGLLWFGLRIDWKILYAGLDPDDARQLGLTLTQAQIPYDVTENGTTLRVAASQLDKARLATAAKGGAKSGRMGFELFDKPNWVGSEFDEQVNYQRALEGELEHTVGSLADVESARVHLVIAHDSLFRDQDRPAKASVVLKLRRGALADGEADAIRNLVASAVDGLQADRVVLVDASGHLPLGPKTADGLQLNAEQALEEKLISTLEPVTGAGNVRASVTLDYDPDAIDETRESYDPAQSAMLSMERSEQTSGQLQIAAGVPGTASNVPNTQPLPVYPKQTTQPQTSKTESGTYGVSKIVRHMVENPGKVHRLTAAIVVNDRMVRPPAKGTAGQWQARSTDELRNLTSLAQAAVGFDATRGDVVSVQDISFEENRIQIIPSVPAQMLSRIESSPVVVKYLSLLIGLMVVLSFGVRPALGKVASAIKATPRELSRGAAAVSQMSLPPVEVALPDPERVRSQKIFEQVASQIKSEPAQSSRLLQSWIHSD
ncbi:flagellar basal-body MS-ring/collar protein FliF [Telmatobacter sp. DSM 110680]|uniref:Flagellar M-ring protein n=1 Tax=Telmatobacter sp. DSM 110680 TaxID=3036704 RepID=A0AAU7DD94_9BACT